MTAKIVSILLALLTLISGTAAASFDPEADLQTQHGYILEMLDAAGELDIEADGTKWLGLAVKRHQQQDDRHATVEFVARYRIGGRGHRLHELSRFVREDGRWYYLDGDILTA